MATKKVNLDKDLKEFVKTRVKITRVPNGGTYLDPRTQEERVDYDYWIKGTYGRAEVRPFKSKLNIVGERRQSLSDDLFYKKDSVDLWYKRRFNDYSNKYEYILYGRDVDDDGSVYEARFELVKAKDDTSDSSDYIKSVLTNGCSE